ncbi:hypothetical protein ALC62_11078 [Cyphomyrmex costatus]|uniref:Uncharacterized protein n=1 Tax=Cyphomyrmex costatus TaxID=456900 RepID=A0A151ICU8_9HYME|nr:hypothetical protein ALC62_11078 [Cyphomyrmex costatus]
MHGHWLFSIRIIGFPGRRSSESPRPSRYPFSLFVSLLRSLLLRIPFVPVKTSKKKSNFVAMVTGVRRHRVRRRRFRSFSDCVGAPHVRICIGSREWASGGYRKKFYLHDRKMFSVRKSERSRGPEEDAASHPFLFIPRESPPSPSSGFTFFLHPERHRIDSITISGSLNTSPEAYSPVLRSYNAAPRRHFRVARTRGVSSHTYMFACTCMQPVSLRPTRV